MAFPAISCGVYGYPITEASRIAIDTTLEFLNKHETLEKIFFVLFSEDDLQIYKDYMEN